MKKRMSLFLAAALLFCLCLPVQAEETADTVSVSNASEFAAAMSSENEGKTILLTADIELDDATYSLPSGSTINGGGHTITVKDNTAENRKTTYLLHLPESGKVTVTNLSIGTLENPVYMMPGEQFTPGGTSAGSLALCDFDGMNNITDWKDVNFFVDHAPGTANGNMAGLCGKASGFWTLENCNMYIVVDGADSASQAGAWFGQSEADSSLTFVNCTTVAGSRIEKGSYAAGYVSQVKGDFVAMGCVNNASVVTHNARAGGFVASHVPSAPNKVFQLVNCVNNGDITSDKNTEACGGLVGRFTAAKKLAISRCVNTGKITGLQNVGGLIGAMFDPMKFVSCLNLGDVESSARAGGLVGSVGRDVVGEIVTLELEDCATVGNVKGNPAGRLCGNIDAGNVCEKNNSLEYGKLNDELPEAFAAEAAVEALNALSLPCKFSVADGEIVAELQMVEEQVIAEVSNPFTTPAAGNALVTAAKAEEGALYTAGSIVWTVDGAPAATAEAGKTYTGKVTLTASENAKFEDGATTVPSGLTAVFGSDGKTLELTYTYAVPGSSGEQDTDDNNKGSESGTTDDNKTPGDSNNGTDSAQPGTENKAGCKSSAGSVAGLLLIVSMAAVAGMRRKE